MWSIYILFTEVTHQKNIFKHHIRIIQDQNPLIPYVTHKFKIIRFMISCDIFIIFCDKCFSLFHVSSLYLTYIRLDMINWEEQNKYGTSYPLVIEWKRNKEPRIITTYSLHQTSYGLKWERKMYFATFICI